MFFVFLAGRLEPNSSKVGINIWWWHFIMSVDCIVKEVMCSFLLFVQKMIFKTAIFLCTFDSCFGKEKMKQKNLNKGRSVPRSTSSVPAPKKENCLWEGRFLVLDPQFMHPETDRSYFKKQAKRKLLYHLQSPHWLSLKLQSHWSRLGSGWRRRFGSLQASRVGSVLGQGHHLRFRFLLQPRSTLRR